MSAQFIARSAFSLAYDYRYEVQTRQKFDKQAVWTRLLLTDDIGVAQRTADSVFAANYEVRIIDNSNSN
jgi:hypothetical protein